MLAGSQQPVDVVLESVGSDPIRLVQVLSSAAGLDPMTAMGPMGRTPVPIAQGVDLASGMTMAEQLQAAGAVVTVGSAGSGFAIPGGNAATARERVSPLTPRPLTDGLTTREAAGPEGAPAVVGASGDGKSGALFGGSSDTRGSGAFQRSCLLPALTGQYRREGDLPAGGEADVLLVSDDAGLRWVVKQFRQPGWASDEDVLERLVKARSGHSRDSWARDERTRSLLWVDRWGVDPASALFYEVAEFVPGGSLARLDRWPLRVLIDSLVAATASFHEAVGAHRDIKPANILVRDAEVPVLVLADVGLARALDGSKRFSKRDGSAAFQAPEAAQGLVSRAGDWWAVGMVVAQAALGYHPMALPNGSLPPDQVLWTELAQRDVPHLDQIRDERVQLLARGLLTRDTDKRWGLKQIGAWARGESPATGFVGSLFGVAQSTGGPGSFVSVSPARVRPVWFNGQDLPHPASLASEFAANTRMAGQMLFEQRDAVLLEDLRLMLSGSGLVEAQSVVDRYQSGAWEPHFLRLLVEMDPTLTPILDGQDLTPAAVYARCSDAIASGACPDYLRTTLRWVIEHDLWRVWRGLPGMGRSAVAAENLKGSLAHWAEDVAGWAGAGMWKTLLLNPDGTCQWWRGPHEASQTELLDEATTIAFWDGQGGRAMVQVWLTLGAAWDAMRPPFELPLSDEGHPANHAEQVSFRGLHPNEHDLANPIIGAERDNLSDQTWWLQLVNHGATAPKVASVVSLPLARIAQAEFDTRARRIEETKAKRERQEEATKAYRARQEAEWAEGLARRRRERVIALLGSSAGSLSPVELERADDLLNQLSQLESVKVLRRDRGAISQVKNQLRAMGLRI